jgi:hypothetical protein
MVVLLAAQDSRVATLVDSSLVYVGSETKRKFRLRDRFLPPEIAESLEASSVYRRPDVDRSYVLGESTPFEPLRSIKRCSVPRSVASGQGYDFSYVR